MKARLTLATSLAAALLAGCATVNDDAALAPVRSAAQQHLQKELIVAQNDADLDRIDQRVNELLAKAPLDADAAIQVALLNNRSLQAALAELGIGQAELVQASRLPNPGFTFAKFRHGDEIERERSLHVNLARLLAMPWLRDMEGRRFAQQQASTATQVLALAADTRRAWVQAVAAQESLRYMRQVQDAADASAELARRMEAVGNFSKLQRAREQSFYADAALGVAHAEMAARAAREKLIRSMGLWGTQTTFKLPDRLPDLPKAARELPDAERIAIAQRLDVQGAKALAEQSAKNLGLTRATRFVNVLELGVEESRSNESADKKRGWELSLELPIFDWGDARVARSQATYMKALHQAAATAVNARSEVREAYGAYRSAWDIARHHSEEIVPLKRRIADENLLRYNGMLIGVFELLADARSQIASVNAAMAALRDFWLAEADLNQALIGKPSLMSLSAPTAAPSSGGGDAH
jgi:outer membrane protein TolC